MKPARHRLARVGIFVLFTGVLQSGAALASPDRPGSNSQAGASPSVGTGADETPGISEPATQNNNPGAVEGKEDKAERIEVTGSHIKRVDVEGVAPVETITHDEIQKKGYTEMGDVVRDLGVNTFGSSTVVSGNSTTPGASDINLRGLGADNTLVLLNGQRLPQDAITGTVDINLIPVAAIERIEILKDGASAIYGSDALGGVVNIITRKDYKGTEIATTGTIPTNYPDGRQTKVSLVNGQNGESYNIVTSLSYLYNEPIYSKNRPWSDNGNSLIGSPASYANQDAGGNDGLWHASPSCPSGSLVTNPNGTFCQYKYSNYSEETPSINQFGGLVEGHDELSSTVRLTSRLSYIHRDAQTVLAPSPGDLLIPSSSVGQFGLPSGTVTPGSNLDVQTRLTPLGTRDTDVTTNGYGGLVGATVQLPEDWSLDVNYTYNLVNSDLQGTSGYALVSTVNQLIQSGAYNPFAPVGSQGNLTGAAYTPWENTQSLLTGIEVKASGDLTEGWAGPIGLAVGTLMNFSSYSDMTDSQTLAGNVFGNAGSSGEGHRTAEAAYSELSVPLVTKKLELQLAGRFDHYSDFGSTANPKVGLLYHATPDLLLRGSVGTGFRAPLLNDLYAGPSIGYPAFIDHVACDKYPGSPYCQAQQYQVTSSGNPGLKQETSVSYTLGAIYEPVKNLNVGTDWFYTKISNMPGIDYNDMTLAQANGVDVSQYGVNIVRDQNGIIQSVTAPLQNLSAVDEFGVDLTGAYVFGRFKLATEQNQLFFYKTEGFPGAGMINKLGWAGMPSWRNNTSLSFFPNDWHDLSLVARSVPKQKMLDQSGYISPFTTFDLNYTYKTKVYGDFSVTLVNILGSSPPLDNSDPTSPVNYALYDPNGQQVVLGYRKAFN